MGMNRTPIPARLRAWLTTLFGPARPEHTAGGDLPAILRCAHEALAAGLDQPFPPSGDDLRRDAALADETARRLGLSTTETAALHAALILTRLDGSARGHVAVPAVVEAQCFRATSLRAADGGQATLPSGSPADTATGTTAPPGSRIDPLTRLPLLPFLFGSFEQDLRRAQAQGRPLSLIQVDIDDFGRLNERHGRAAGDRVLRGVARAIRSTLRPGDTCVRCADDAFVLTVPGVGADGIAAVVTRLETVVGRHKFAVARGITVQVRVTIGAAAFPDDGRTHESLLAVAEARRLDRLLARRRRPEDADRHVHFPSRRDVTVN